MRTSESAEFRPLGCCCLCAEGSKDAGHPVVSEASCVMVCDLENGVSRARRRQQLPCPVRRSSRSRVCSPAFVGFSSWSVL